MAFHGRGQTVDTFSYLIRRGVRKIQAHVAAALAAVVVSAIVGIERIAGDKGYILLQRRAEDGLDVEAPRQSHPEE